MKYEAAQPDGSHLIMKPAGPQRTNPSLTGAPRRPESTGKDHQAVQMLPFGAIMTHK